MDRQLVASILSLSIPIIAIVLGIGIGMLSLVLDYRKRRDMFAMHHKERMAAIDKGMEVPPLPPEFFQENRRRGTSTPGDYLRRGLLLLMVGLAITVALYRMNNDLFLWGLVPTAVGVAYLLFYWFEVRKAAKAPPA